MENIEQKLNKTFKVYTDLLQTISKESFAFKESADIWSLAQMYEHVYDSGYTFFIANINRCLEERKGQIGGDLTDAGSYILYKDGFPPKTKYQHPNHKKGNGPEIVGQSIEVYKKGMPELLEAMLSKIEEVKKDDGEYKTQHFVFGWLNANQWLRNAEFHIRHHISQMEELLNFYKSSKVA